jgi:hypothetical protein
MTSNRKTGSHDAASSCQHQGCRDEQRKHYRERADHLPFTSRHISLDTAAMVCVLSVMLMISTASAVPAAAIGDRAGVVPASI